MAKAKKKINFDDFLEKMIEIESRGYIETHREGPTGIGKTIEDLLGIEENPKPEPDLELYELKSGRKRSSSMMTLLTRTPSLKGAIKNLLNVYGYVSKTDFDGFYQTPLFPEDNEDYTLPVGKKKLNQTISATKANKRGFQLRVEDQRIHIDGTKNVVAYYDIDELRTIFAGKTVNVAHVLADHKRIGGIEYFHYNEVYKLQGFALETYPELVKKGIIKVDLRWSSYDHGTGFRVLPRDLPICFEQKSRVL